jgi:hypothetical protein
MEATLHLVVRPQTALGVPDAVEIRVGGTRVAWVSIAEFDRMSGEIQTIRGGPTARSATLEEAAKVADNAHVYGNRIIAAAIRALKQP